jgi:acetylornithine deacetylase/succinyl-diaminopimelate desuccinylase-like protein
MRAIAEAVEQLMQRVGIGTRLSEWATVTQLFTASAAVVPKSFVVYGHYDVQPVGHLTEWSVGPFAGDDQLMESSTPAAQQTAKAICGASGGG